MNTGWTEVDDEILRRGVSAGVPFSQLAAMIGHGITRNACIGRARRLCLAPGARPAKPRLVKEPRATSLNVKPSSLSNKEIAGRARAAIERSARPAPAPPPRMDAVAIIRPAIECWPVTVVDLTDAHCRWPIGDAVEDFDAFRYCGAAKTREASYCAHHRAMSVAREYSAAERKDYLAERAQRRQSAAA